MDWRDWIVGISYACYKYSGRSKVKQPSIKTMTKWLMDGIARATDGCKVEPDGTCPHGKRSWLLELGYI